MEQNGGGKVASLIEKATNSTSPEIEPRILKAIKNLVRFSDSELRLASLTLMDLMKRDHSQVRYLSFLIIDELFMRSKLFRTLIVENFDQLLSLSIGFRRNLPLPAPPAIASRLRSKSIECLEKWNVSYGVNYRQIRLGFDYLKNTLRFQFPNLQANAARLRTERMERERRTMEILRGKFELLKGKLGSVKEEVESTIDEIGECLEIVLGKEEPGVSVPLDDEEFEEVHSSELRRIRLNSIREGEKVREDSENKVVFDALRELYKLVVMKHLVFVQESISVLIRVETADNRTRDCMLKECIDMQKRLQAVRKNCEESGCALPDIRKKDDEEEDFWEEGKIEFTSVTSSSAPEILDENVSIASTSRDLKNVDAALSSKPPNSKVSLKSKDGETNTSALRDKLLAEAPVLEWGSFLDTWSSNRDVLANQRGLELESHWGRVDQDAVIPAEKIAQLNVPVTLYKEEPVDIQPCRAPLRKGGLCQRKDLEVCPFHGPIIRRDSEGNPIDQNPPVDDATLDLGTDLVEQLAKQAVKNVRDKDNEDARKRKLDKQQQKRAKLAKIREHNEEVLMDAAMASTSSSSLFSDELQASRGEGSSSKIKKETLASMLRKKVTAKDRLSQKLLNGRARDATVRQLTLGEDASYREAFPNQW